MKYKSLIIGIISLFVIVSCDNLSDINYDEEYVIPVTKSVETADNKYLIRFDSVFTDSRCPMEANCFWSGVAGVRFTISVKNNGQKAVELYTLNNKEWADSVIYNNLKIKLLELTPYPSLTTKFDYSVYKAKIKISKVK